MSKISPDLLTDTLNLVQLARETALARGKKSQAERLAPVADNLRTLVTNTRQSTSASGSSGVMQQSDFKTMLAAAQASPRLSVQPLSSSLERNQIVNSMSAAGMTELDIARQMGLTRDEVRMIVKLSDSSQSVRRPV